MNFEWIAMEHYRLHMIEEWPEGPYKEASLAAIRSTLQRLLGSESNVPICEVCFNRPQGPAVLEFPELFEDEEDSSILAA